MRQLTLNITDDIAYNYPPGRARELRIYQAPQQQLELLAHQLTGISDEHRIIAANAFIRRGVNPLQLASYVTDPSSPQELDLPAPLNSLKNLEAVVDRITRAIRNLERIGIVGDFDVDGTTSIAVMANTLSRCKANYEYHVPNRFIDGFGISERIADQLIKSEIKLVILLDHGSQAHKVISKLRRAGIDVIVIDHHAISGDLPDALVINPRQPGCGLNAEYPCACTLTTAVCHALTDRLNIDPPSWDLAGFATIADMVPIGVGSLNRHIAVIGLAELSVSSNPGIIALALANQIPRDPTDTQRLCITSEECAFALGPSINALGRLDDAARAVELLTTTDGARAKELATEIVKTNETRKKLSRGAAHQSLLDIASDLQNPRYAGAATVYFRDTNHAGLNGLLAQTLAQRFGKPAFVFAKSGINLLTASARSGHPGYDLHAILERVAAVDKGEIVTKWGGHAPAAGVTIYADQLERFVELLQTEMNSLYAGREFPHKVIADARLKLAYLTPELVKDLEKTLAPYGNGFPAPQLLFENLFVNKVYPPWEPGGKFMLEVEQSGAKRRCFIGPELWSNEITEGSSVNLIGVPAAIYRSDAHYVQLSVQAIELSSKPTTDPIFSELRSPTTTAAHIIDRVPTREEHDHFLPPLDSGGRESRTGLRNSLVARLKRCEARRGKRAKKPEVYPLRYTEDFFAKFDEVAARISSTGAEDISETGSSETKVAKAKAQLDNINNDFDSRWLYPDLAELETDPFNPKGPEFWRSRWLKHIERCGLKINWQGRELRPSHVEVLRVLSERTDNFILQAPTGSGKTDIALSFASRYTANDKLVVFVAPTNDIVAQVAGRANSLLSINPLVLNGENTTPEKRKSLYETTRPQLIVSTPHTLANDIREGIFKLPKDGLLIVDEAHHATGDYPAVPLIEHARQQSTRILALTATPGQPDRAPGGKRAPYRERWQRLNRLKELVGVESIFPLNHPSNRVSLRPVWLKQFTHITQAQENLTDMLRSLRSELFNRLGATPSSRTGIALKKLFRDPFHEQIEFRSEYSMSELRATIRTEYESKGNIAQSIIRSISALSALHDALESRGISSFVKDTLKLRLYQLFSPNSPSNYSGQSAVKPPLYISRLLDGAKLKAAFDSVAPESVRHLWDSTALEELANESAS
ncbi:MAG: DHH family phosphoesterase, partial [Pseudomonadota bacterium]